MHIRSERRLRPCSPLEIENCSRKRSWPTKKRAREFNRQVGGPRLRAYRCPACGLYHLASIK